MARSLRAVANLKAATALITTVIVGGVLVVGAGAGTPVILNLAKDKVIEVKNLQDAYTLTYGENLDLDNCVIVVGNEFNKEGSNVEGKNLKIEGFDSEYIGTKEVLVSYLDYSKKINVTINPYKLGTPAPVFNNATGILSWEPVLNGDEYTVVISDATTGTETSRKTSKERQYDFNNVQVFTAFKVSVFASNAKKGSNDASCFLNSELSEAETLQKLHNVANVRYEDGAFKWDPIDSVTNYEVHVNGQTFSPAVPQIEFDTTAAGEYKVSVRGVAGAGAFATPTEATFRRLPTPVLSFDGEAIQVANGETVAYKMDGEDFNGAASSIVEPGAHAITAVNMAQTQYELQSTTSNTLTLTKLTAPTLSLEGGVLSCAGIASTNSAKYFDNGTEFDGQLSSITGEGAHTITAKQVGSGNQIPSAASNEIVVTKRAAPIASFDGSHVEFSGKSDNFRVVVDGERREYTEVSAELIETLSDSQVHSIAGVNLGNGNDILNSDLSNEVTFVVPKINATTSYEKYGVSDLAKLRLTHEIAGRDQAISAKVKVEYFKVSPADGEKVSDDLIETNFVVAKESPSVGAREFNMRGAKVVRFTIELNDVEGLQMFKTEIVKDVNVL